MVCRFCGRPTDIRWGGEPICEGCYQDAGSCCPEFGGADLWREREADSGAADGPPPDDPPAAAQE